MIDSIEKLRNSITDEQKKTIRSVLGNDLADLLQQTLASETEDEAKRRSEDFVVAAKKHPFKMVKLFRNLTPEQKGIIHTMMPED